MNAHVLLCPHRYGEHPIDMWRAEHPDEPNESAVEVFQQEFVPDRPRPSAATASPARRHHPRPLPAASLALLYLLPPCLLRQVHYAPVHQHGVLTALAAPGLPSAITHLRALITKVRQYSDVMKYVLYAMITALTVVAMRTLHVRTILVIPTDP